MDDIIKKQFEIMNKQWRVVGILTAFISVNFYEKKLTEKDMLVLEELLQDAEYDVSTLTVGRIFKQLKKETK
jgi:hypothetical protein